jgi:hypothetical protein
MVNGAPITDEDVRRAASPFKLKARKGAKDARELARLDLEVDQRVLDSLIDRAVIADVCHRRGIRATDAEVDEEIRGIAAKSHWSTAELLEEVRREEIDVPSYRDVMRANVLEAKLFAADLGGYSTTATAQTDWEELVAHYRERAVIERP